MTLASKTEEWNRVLQSARELPQLLFDIICSSLEGIVLSNLVGDVLRVQREILELPEVHMLVQGGVNQLLEQLEIFRLRKTNIFQ